MARPHQTGCGQAPALCTTKGNSGADRALFDFRNGGFATRDLNNVTNLSTKYRTSEGGDVGYSPACRFGFIFTNDAECLHSAVISSHRDGGPKMNFAFVSCRFDDLRARSSRIPISKFALGRRDRRAVVFSYGGFVCFFTAAKCPLDRRKAFSSYEVRVRRDRPIRQVINQVLDFLNKRATHVIGFRCMCQLDATSGQHRPGPAVPYRRSAIFYDDNCIPNRPSAGNFIAGLRRSIPITPPSRFSSIPSTQPIFSP